MQNGVLGNGDGPVDFKVRLWRQEGERCHWTLESPGGPWDVERFDSLAELTQRLSELVRQHSVQGKAPRPGLQ
ncbi:hypothetical protein [Deinococcus hopiensis]|uniref:Uncharacterized protein n=1 Tax=Deinococcus hopiensis KR-140 TaxID=695939 RepID=A0A1W1VWD5_9DEIO|nr:hypothetical protein [Deinococcus hopiensis]SMB97563.1 hypothetical protein SAMN00790413_06060 [Deinococcus hopiensis KR-140]